MSRLISTRLAKLCSDEWVAKAYGEYLSDCAAAQAELLASMTDLISSESLDALTTLKSDDISDKLSTINSLVYEFMVDQGIMDAPQRSTEDPEFVAAGKELLAIADPDGEPGSWASKGAIVKDSIVYLQQTYPNTILFGTTGDYPSFFDVTNRSVDDVIYSDSEVTAQVDTIVNEKLQAMKLNADTVYTLDSGFITYKDLLTQVTLKSALRVSDENVGDFVKDLDGHSQAGTELFVDDLVEQVKSGFASTTAWAQGFFAVASSSVVEALAHFEAQIKAVFTNSTERFAASIAQVRALISSTNANVHSFIDQASELLGFNQVVEDTFTSVDQTDVYAYTGASPLAGINLKSVTGVLQVTGRAVVAVGLAVWTGVKSLAKKLWKKVKPIAKAITSNPIDIETSDSSDDSYSIGNFNFQKQGVSVMLNYGAVAVSINSSIAKLYTVLTKMTDSWFAINTHFFEAMFKINTYSVSRTGASSIRVALNIDYKLRIRNVNPDIAKDYGLVKLSNPFSEDGYRSVMLAVSSATDPAIAWSTYDAFISNNSIRFDDISDENRMLASFVYSILIGSQALGLCHEELVRSFRSYYDFYPITATMDRGSLSDGPQYDTPLTSPTVASAEKYLNEPVVNAFTFADTSSFIPSTVTNKDFIAVSCGYAGPQNDKGFEWLGCANPVPGASDTFTSRNHAYNAGFIISQLISLLIMQHVDRNDNPTNYLFLPYCKGSYDFSAGRYNIKTDAENKNVAQIMVNAIIVIAIVVAAVLICKTIIKVRRTKRIAKMSNYLGQQDNAIWSANKTLSYKEQRKYLRYSKKVDKLTSASSGLVGSAASSAGVISDIRDKVMNNVDVPKSIAQGSVIMKQAEKVNSVSSSVNDVSSECRSIKLLITG